MSLTTPPSRPVKLPTLLLCLLAAAVIWLLNALNKNSYTVSVQYPIEFVYNQDLFVPTSPLPKTISVNITGNGWKLFRQSWLPFRSSPIRYPVNKPLQTKFINTASLAESLTDHAKDVRINFVAGDTLALNFDRLAAQEVPVVVDSANIDLADRMVVSSLINVSPRTIRFEGPARLLRAVPDTIKVKIPARRLALSYDEELKLPIPRHPLIRASADQVAVSFEVAELLQPLPPPPAPEPAKPIKTAKPKNRSSRKK
ncbi:YbbR-like domain-containing protein [Larkinella harenae]